MKIEPRFRADFPEVDVTALLRAIVTAESRPREGARGVRTAAVPEALLGRRTFSMDVELDTLGGVRGDGYAVVPREARLAAWRGSS